MREFRSGRGPQPMRRRALAAWLPALLSLLLLAAAVAPAAAREVQIWFVPLTWNKKETGKGLEYTRHDFPALIRPDAPWQTAASRVAVLGLPGNVVTSFPALPDLVSFVRSRPWQIALNFGMEYSSPGCVVRLEGFSRDIDVNREAVHIAQRWHAAGGRLDYVLMDSPLHFAHFDRRGCQYSIAEAAAHAATTLRGILAEFPAAKVVDAEGPGKQPTDAWLADMGTWFTAFRQASGHPIDVVLLDLHWRDPRPFNTWQDTASRAAAYFHRAGVPTGLIIDAEAVPGGTNAQWIAQNRQHIAQSMQPDLGLDILAIDQWQRRIERNLPETDPTAYTSLINDAYDAIRRANPQ